MKNYERLDITVEALGASDVIATSEEVTTGKITINWGAGATDAANYELD